MIEVEVINVCTCPSYDPVANAYEWPLADEKLPDPRGYQSVFVQGSAVFLFGGVDSSLMAKNELCVLDMNTMEFRKVHDDTAASGTPSKRGSPTMTEISPGKAVLYGGFDDARLSIGDCWVLDTPKALEGKQSDPSSLWTKVASTKELPPRHYHTAVTEPRSGRLYVFGGTTTFPQDKALLVPFPLDKALVLELTPAPLELLAMERAIGHYGREDPQLEEFLPRGHAMRMTLEARRQMSSLEEKRSN